jgi:hypothetical protein
MEASVGPTVNRSVLVTPFGVATLMLLAVCAALLATVQFAVTVVADDPETVQVTPVPDTFTAVAPVKMVPVRVITKPLPPVAWEVGLIEPSVGPFTVNRGVLASIVVMPIGVVALTALATSPAVAVMVHVALIVVAVGVPVMVQVTPVPTAPAATAVAPVRFVPVMVTATVEPRAPDEGVIEFNVGPVTVNTWELLIPVGDVTVTCLAVVVAVVPPAIVNVAVAVFALTLVRPLTVTPPPGTVTDVTPARFVPVRVT